MRACARSERGRVPLEAKESSRDKGDGECEEGKESILRQTRGEIGGSEGRGSRKSESNTAPKKKEKKKEGREGGRSLAPHDSDVF